MLILRITQAWIRRLLKTAKRWWIQKHANEAAALAFYSLFSLIPILIIGLTVASWVVDKEQALQNLLEKTNSVTGFSVNSYLTQILSQDVTWIGSQISPVLGGCILAFSATKVITELRRALSKVFGVPRYRKKTHAALAGLVGRLTSLLLIILLGISIATAVIYETILSILQNSVTNSTALIKAVSFASPIITLLAMTILTATVMRWLPRRPPLFKEALIGGFVSSILLIFLKFGLTKFISTANIGDIYGGAITLVLILLWIYLVMQAVLYGAELAATLAEERRQSEEEATETLEGGVSTFSDSSKNF